MPGESPALDLRVKLEAIRVVSMFKVSYTKTLVKDGEDWSMTSRNSLIKRYCVISRCKSSNTDRRLVEEVTEVFIEKD